MRFQAVDQTRGLAISAMIWAHFGPGLWERIGLQGLSVDILSLIGRFATPTFIAIFGFTIAFAYLEKARTDPKPLRRKLISRSGIVLLAAIAISVPSYMQVFWLETYWGGSLALQVMLNSYSVLLFYAFAIFIVAWILPRLAQAPATAPVILGSALILLGTWLGYDTWQSQGESLAEWVRLILVSGKYALLTNLGVALLLVTFGWHVRARMQLGEAVVPMLLVAGIVLFLCSLSLGRISGWRTLEQLHSEFGAPPQLWYLGMICGVMFMIIALLHRVKIPGLSFILDHTGRNPLSIYVAHAFVLPAVALLRDLFPGLPGILTIVIPLSIFLLYWAYVVYTSSQLQKPAKAASTSPGQPQPAMGRA